MKRVLILMLLILSVIFCGCGTIDNNIPNEKSSVSIEDNKSEEDMEENMQDDIFLIMTNGITFIADFENNSSAKAMKELLKKGDITIEMQDYGNFEKVGSLGVSLPTNDKRITTEPGDVILYMGNKITVY